MQSESPLAASSVQVVPRLPYTFPSRLRFVSTPAGVPPPSPAAPRLSSTWPTSSSGAAPARGVCGLPFKRLAHCCCPLGRRPCWTPPPPRSIPLRPWCRPAPSPYTSRRSTSLDQQVCACFTCSPAARLACTLRLLASPALLQCLPCLPACHLAVPALLARHALLSACLWAVLRLLAHSTCPSTLASPSFLPARSARASYTLATNCTC